MTLNLQTNAVSLALSRVYFPGEIFLVSVSWP